MSESKDKIKLFEEKQVRTVWDADVEKWWFSVVDIVAVLTDQDDYQLARNYWKVLKNRLRKEGNESVTNCNQLKLEADDGKKYLTDVADTEQVLPTAIHADDCRMSQFSNLSVPIAPAMSACHVPIA